MSLLEVTDLAVTFASDTEHVTAVRGLNLRVDAGEVVAVVGESGSGKSASAMALIGLLPPHAEVSGSVRLDGEELLGLDDGQMSRIRGRKIGTVFQDPMSALTPVYTVGDQIAEALQTHQRGMGRTTARARAVELLELVGIAQPERRARSFPHELSGGERQRVVIAIAIANDPDLLICDEPTTALDVTVQAQILELIVSLQKKLGTAVILITHDLGLVAQTAQRVIVMYAGRKVEEAAVGALFASPQHQYTRGLMASLPRLGLLRGEAAAPGRLQEIPGMVPPLTNLPQGCAFAPRCPRADERCRTDTPPYEEKSPGHWAACWHPGPANGHGHD